MLVWRIIGEKIHKAAFGESHNNLERLPGFEFLFTSRSQQFDKIPKIASVLSSILTSQFSFSSRLVWNCSFFYLICCKPNMASRDRDYGRKYESGSVKRKRKERQLESEKKMRGSITKFLVSSELKSVGWVSSENQECCNLDPQASSPIRSDGITDSVLCAGMTDSVSCPGITDSVPCDGMTDSVPSAGITDSVICDGIADFGPCAGAVNIEDPGLWPEKITRALTLELVEKGPVRVNLEEYPQNEGGRRFRNAYYTRVLGNGEKQDRRWLVYSKSKDATYCFACRLFSTKMTAFNKEGGMRNWKKMGESLQSHESSREHKESLLQWLALKKGLKSGKTIDHLEYEQMEAERRRWREILEKVLHIIKYLATHNQAFRGHRETLEDDDSSGNFLDLAKLIARFDPVLKNHLDQFKRKKIRSHYLGPKVQNELIQLMAMNVKKEITDRLKKNKYYAVILDCTRDISRVEQMSIILRFYSKETAKIEEHFVGFVAVEKTTGESLTDEIIQELANLNISLEDCRGQGYDNGANMKGEKSGVQKRILNLNPLAFFVPCGCHSLNLVVGDAAASCAQAKTFFGTLQRVYTLFAGSSERWRILKTQVDLTVKPLSETRWECRVESVKAVKYQLKEVCAALEDLAEKTSDCLIASECASLENELTTIEFIMSLVIWYDILFKINLVSKTWQGQSLHMDVAVSHVKAFLMWLEEYRESGFQSALATAREMAEEVNASTTFKVIRKGRKTRMFDYESTDKRPDVTPEEMFRISYFLVIVDTVRTSVKPRFKALQTHADVFGFIYRIKDSGTLSESELTRSCKHLETTMTKEGKCDFDANELQQEIRMFSNAYDGDGNMLSTLNYITQNDLEEVYPNLNIVLRVIITMPVTVASAERSFSRLKLIKTYLRSTMSQERLSCLAQLSIENDVAAALNFENIIVEFSRKKSRNFN